MTDLTSHLRRALRSLGRSPVLTGVAIVTLALSIGLTTAVFSIVNAVVLRPLPVSEPERLVAFCELERGQDDSWCGASVPNIYDVAERSRSIEVAGAARGWPLIMKTTEGADGVRSGLATPGAFASLGITPLAGRLIEEGDQGETFRRVVVVSHAFWQARLGGRRDAVGQALVLDEEPYTIVGILPPSASIPELEQIELWRPIHFDPRSEQVRDWRGFRPYARLRAGATIEQARVEVATIASTIQREHFAAKPGWRIELRGWQDVVVGSVRRSMYIFLGAVGLVLLIGCANVANLLLAQATVRRRDMALHAALGASRAQLVRGLFLESLTLALAGAAAGLLIAVWGARAFVALAPSGIPRLDEVSLDPTVLAFTLGVSILTTVLVGTAPALRATSGALHETLMQGGRTGTARRARLGPALIVGEIALALVLVSGAGLLVRSFVAVMSWRPGFDQEHLLTTWVLASPGRFQDGRAVAEHLSRAAVELRSIPSVVAVGSGSAGPLFGGDGEGHFAIDGQPASAETRQATLWYDIGPEYFRALGLPILRGRGITDEDEFGGPLVAVINETFARRHFPGTDPIGRTIRMLEHEADFRIVGIVRDVPPVRPGDPTPAEIYWSNRQAPRPATYFIVRTGGDPSAVARAIPARLAAFDPDLQLSEVRTMKHWLGEKLVRPRFAAALLATFGTLALVLAAVGTYGLLAYSVAQRTKEIGIRMALGANPRAIVSGVIGRGLRLTSVAIVLGLAGSLALTRLLAGQLAGVTPTDPLTFGTSIVLLLGAALAACLLPARRASRVDPLVALRAE
jgi:putative ABC transport system permease protein